MISKYFQILYLAIFLILIVSCKENTADIDSQSLEVPTAIEIIQEMGPGFNLGNTFDLNSQSNSNSFNDLAPIIIKYKSAGMKHVRIPATWMDGFSGDHLADEEGNINFQHPRFIELKRVIDFALEQGLYVVINAHHEREFKENYNGSDEYDQKFTTLWENIANHFKDYDYHLIFELLNEPEGAFGSWGGEVSPSNSEGIALTRQLMEVGVEAVRSTGGNNIKRVVFISTNGQGNHSQIDEVYPNLDALPRDGEDDYIAIQIHTYDPWPFCGQNGDNSAYPGDAVIEKSIRDVAAHGRFLGVPLNYGEFGVGRDGNQNQRNTALVRGYYRTVVQTALDEGMSTSVWDDRGWFGLISGSSQEGYEFVYDIVPTMLAD
ncbi:MAG: hypothetical protein BalsKO_14860 [Balneolaceae bacterium]